MLSNQLLLAMSQMKVDGNIAFLFMAFKLIFFGILPRLDWWQLMDQANLIYFIRMTSATFYLEKLLAQDGILTH